MKTTMILLACIACLVGCDNGVKKYDIGDPFSIIVVDSCEYIQHSHWFAHKGNCKYCRERNKVTFYELDGGVPKTSAWTDASKATRDTMVISKWTDVTDIAPKKSELIK